MGNPAFRVDPLDPRAPPEDVWDAMTPEERRRIIKQLPAEEPKELYPPETDPHRLATTTVLDTLGTFFRKIGRRVYLSSDLNVFYPNERRFAPDVLAVFDAETHERDRWVVSAEGKGLDFVLEVLVRGDWVKDLSMNVERYARLGIQEYFVFDWNHERLTGYQLGEDRKRYQPILPEDGRWHSRVLGLDLVASGKRVRFHLGTATLLDSQELLAEANTMLTRVMEKKEEEAQRAEEEARRADEVERRLEEETRRADDAERRLAEALAEIEQLRNR